MTGALPPELAEALAGAGVAVGAGGDDAAGLLAAAEARGLAASVEEVAGTSARSARGALLLRAGGGSVRGRGRTEAEALAKALLVWLRRGTDG